MKKYYLVFLIILCLASCISCNANFERPLINEKILIKTDKNNLSEIKVVLEGEDGNCIDGAFVAIKTSWNDYLILEYNNDIHSYYAKSILTENDNISFIINSILLDESKEVIVPHFQLTQKPLLKVFYDTEGNSVLKGNKVNPKEEIQIAWDYPIEDCVYKVSVSTSLQTIYETSTKSMTAFIPANTLENEKYYFLKIEAQKSKGDILFEKDNYYSVSVTETENIQFTTK